MADAPSRLHSSATMISALPQALCSNNCTLRHMPANSTSVAPQIRMRCISGNRSTNTEGTDAMPKQNTTR
ncbi:hypothetical protein D7S86_07005 [Pararobbsia silviterrae]|uniref:Uncharacterized protein n=1 Tax=Pararobbsia silviterrae TaxID=1792498 RepID=A0A494Y6H2_9BURK|nr:hypothetical protein D7S86_07005 [Pararobbsia silviterrae]